MAGEKLSVGLGTKANWWAELPADIAENSGPGQRPVGWVVLMAGFLLPLLLPASNHLLSSERPLWWVILGFALLVVYSLFYVFFPVFVRRSRRTNFASCVAMVFVGLALFFFYGNSPYVVVYATGMMVFALPAAWSLILSGATLLVIAVALLATGKLEDSYGDLIAVVSVTFTLFMVSRLVFAVRALQQANRRIATMAVDAERERMARDLHDILGHSLTTITVKAGLARRVLESSGDVERAIVEIRDVETLTRSVLSDVRTTLSENREVSLSAELVGARVALRAAGIEAEFPSAVDNLRPELQCPFGYVLREAVTNVLRHSGAGRVRVRLGDTWMEVEDDGAGTTAGPGNGLRGLEERLMQIGGTIHAAPRAQGGFLVRAESA